MRKVIIAITVITLILSILSTWLIVLFTAPDAVTTPTVTGQTN